MNSISIMYYLASAVNHISIKHINWWFFPIEHIYIYIYIYIVSPPIAYGNSSQFFFLPYWSRKILILKIPGFCWVSAPTVCQYACMGVCGRRVHRRRGRGQEIEVQIGEGLGCKTYLFRDSKAYPRQWLWIMYTDYSKLNTWRYWNREKVKSHWTGCMCNPLQYSPHLRGVRARRPQISF